MKRLPWKGKCCIKGCEGVDYSFMMCKFHTYMVDLEVEREQLSPWKKGGTNR